MQVLDLPGLYTRTKQGDDFIFALSKCSDLDFFTLKNVQIVIDR